MLLFLFTLSSQAQYSCPTATFIEVKDSCELETYYHSGYDDRWFTFTPETSGVGFQIEWDYTPRWAYIPYDTLYVYTESCDSLVEYAVFSPIPTAGQAIFDGNSDVFLRFSRTANSPANVEFDLCLFGITLPLEFKNLKGKIGFVENKGQFYDQYNMPNASIKYLLNLCDGFNVQLREDGFSYDTYTFALDSNLNNGGILDFHRVDIELVNSNPNPSIAAYYPSDAYFNYFNMITNDSSATYVRYYEKVVYSDVYNGIDLEFVFQPDSIAPFKYNFIVHPGYSPSQIQIKYNGANNSVLNMNKIYLELNSGIFMENIPYSYLLQSNLEVDVEYFEGNNEIYGFITSDYDSSQTLIIDPVPDRVWGRYFGGCNVEEITSMKNDIDDNLIITGFTNSQSGLATAGAYIANLQGWPDAFLAKIDPNGNTIWATYYGGSGWDESRSLDVDENGNIVMVGFTLSNDIISPSASYYSHNSLFNNGFYNPISTDCFIAKFNSSGIRVWDTYYGDKFEDRCHCVSIEDTYIYIAGETKSSLAIATGGAVHQNFNAGGSDGFVAKFNSNGYRQWGSYFGGNNDDRIFSIDVEDNMIFVAGGTNSNNGISTTNPFNNLTSAFVARFDANTGQRYWGRYIGGEDIDYAYGLSSDGANHVYVIGATGSSTGIAYNSAPNSSFHSGNKDAFLTKLNHNGDIVWSNYFGGTGNDFAEGIFIKSKNNIYITGYTTSANGITDNNPFPTWQQNPGSSFYQDAFLAKFSHTGDLNWATYYGGVYNDYAYSVCIDNNDNIYIAGATESSTFSSSHAVSDLNLMYGLVDGFIAKFHEPQCDVEAYSNSPVCEGETIHLYASGGQYYTWSGPLGFNSNDQNPEIPNATIHHSGTYTVTITNDYGCYEILTLEVVVILIEKPEFSIPWEWACADEIVFTIENYDPSLQYFYTIDDPFATYEPLPLLGASSPLPQVEIPWPGMTGGIIYIHVLDDYGCYAYDSLMVFNCCIDPLSGDFYYNNTFSGNQTINGQSFYMNGTIDFAPLSNYQFIDCNFYFSPNTKMIIPDFVNVSINKSGSLQACDPLMWDGVYIYGSGFLTIAGGSPTNVLIQDAKHAVVSENGGRYAIKNATFDKNYNHLSVYSQPCAAHTGEIHTSELICSDIILPQYPPVFAQRTRFAIDIRGIRSITIGKAGPANRKNTIENCDVGIYSWNSMVNVSNNHFKEINVPFMSSVIQGMPSHPRGYAIYSYAGPMGVPFCNDAPSMYQRGLITSNIGMLKTNVFTNCTRGIFLHDNQIANIIRNDFINGPNVNGYAAIEFSSFFYQGQKNVSVNKIEGYRFGITATNTNNMVVNGNVIEKLNLPPWLFGTQVSAGIEIKGGANNIINANTVNNSAKPQHFRYEGIKVVQSASSLTMCNTLRSLGKAIRYSGTCVPAEIKLNKMFNSTLGFCLSDNGYTGQQGIMGEPWDNTWHGTFTHHLYTMNNTNGQALTNRWYISNQTGPKNPPATTFAEPLSYPIQINQTSGMLSPGLCAVPLLSFQISYQPLLDDIALDQVPALQNPHHRRWISRDGLMKTIDANPHLLQSPVLQNFRTVQQFESTGQLEIVLDTVSKGYITEGRMLNDAIQPVSEPDSLARAVHQIMLNADLINTQFFADAFDTTAVAQLQQFAQLCPFVHGNYVFVCRVLLQMTGDTTEYWHVCEEDADFIPGKAMPIADEISQLKIYPNPANDFVTVETDMPLPATMYLYNTMGQKIDEIQIIDAITVLDVSKYKQQLIFYHINGKSGKISLMQ